MGACSASVWQGGCPATVGVCVERIGAVIWGGGCGMGSVDCCTGGTWLIDREWCAGVVCRSGSESEQAVEVHFASKCGFGPDCQAGYHFVVLVIV
ncbi:hypothetical protein BCR44DRAFT_1427890 [Catenaria anguillulae PL171]|uniref:Uncharacterized protein n=1 Tax=Catenaria anguillulae PL171 TaxID=765915 RepID=A0A1Y2HW68_9FUNG|nr:hypothetical protein BCR44DRAFT_1427890 [Catenaria anguillulae PL171]